MIVTAKVGIVFQEIGSIMATIIAMMVQMKESQVHLQKSLFKFFHVKTKFPIL